MFAEFIQKHFRETFENSANPCGKLFLQDGDPSQNGKKAKTSIHTVGAKKFDIPPRSPDINPIENIFNFAKAQIQADALQRNINKESFEQYSKRVKHTLENHSIDYITKTIGSMDKRG